VFMYIHTFSCFCCKGQVGIGSNVTISGDTPRYMTTVDFGPGALVTAVSIGAHFSCAIVDGTVKCWGDNSNGELGQGNTVNLGDTPATIPAKIKPIK
jgi:alpha-tubulin suppressor-like RCC1 family protein